MRLEFRDLFKESICLYNEPDLIDILFNPEAMEAIANFHFKKKHWEEAAEAYDTIEFKEAVQIVQILVAYRIGTFGELL